MKKDPVFREEELHLVEVESTLDQWIAKYEHQAEMAKGDGEKYIGWNWGNHTAIYEQQHTYSSAMQKVEEYKSVKAEPYFGRLDLDWKTSDGYEAITVYIGDQLIANGADTIVIDWRSDIGECYYSKSQTEFNVDGEFYRLLLRRALEIKRARLLSYHTDYDAQTISLEGDVIDPFLLTVLQDKRRQYRMTNIIRSIQENQNMIIRRPRNESFVVQGCAGSGKTMILLHRLSYLMFNNKSMNLSRVKIITPNPFFNAKVNDLSAELGITTIERYSVEEYYAYLLKRFTGKTMSAEVESEKTLHPGLMHDLYSVEYMNEAVAQYHNHWESVLRELNEDKLKALFAQYKVKYPTTQVHRASSAEELEQGIHAVSNIIKQADEKIKLQITIINSAEERLKKETKACENHLLLLEARKGNLRDQVSTTEETMESVIRTHQNQAQEITMQIEDGERAVAAAQAAVKAHQKQLGEIKQDISAYTDYESFKTLHDEVAQEISNTNKELIKQIEETKTALGKVPVYNFTKRNKLRKMLEELQEQFAKAVTKQQYAKGRDVQAHHEALIKKRQLLEKTLGELKNKAEQMVQETDQMQKQLHYVKKLMNLLNAPSIPNLDPVPLTYYEKDLRDAIVAYNKEYSDYRASCKKRDTVLAELKNLNQKLLHLQEQASNNADVKYLDGCEKVLKRLQLSEISRLVLFKSLRAKYKEYGQKYSKTNYRHKLYLKLLYSSLYYGLLANPDAFLNIDEAQDISVAEYTLLRNIVGEKCVFNLYGDINQTVYNYKGIADWEEIFHIVGEQVYVLNENYRNTLQITEFCNREFDAEIQPIGISGDDVVELSLEKAVSRVVQEKKRHPEHRIAILHRYGLKGPQERLEKLFANVDVSWYTVDDHRISVMSVEMAKGLEFETVVVLADQMSENEKYISYTRAMNQLVVVRDSFSDELIQASADEDDGEDDYL